MSDFSQSQGSTPNLVLSPEEKKVFGQLFQAADTQNLGVITGELAVKFFEKSGLKPLTLGEIWGIADTDNRGLLTKVGFSVALRLIGQAQAGQQPRAELALQPGPLPTFKGVTIAYPSSPQQPQQSPTSPIQRQISGSAVIVPRLSPEDVARYTDLFEKSGPVDGVLSGENARQIFQKAKLLNSTLGIIWSLADRQQRGALGPAEFVIAMHLIQCTMNGSLPVLPTSLPPAIFDAAAGRPSRVGSIDGRQRPLPGSTVSRQVTGQVPIPPIPKQFSGNVNPQRAQSPLRRQFTPPSGPPPIQTSNDVPWVVNQQDKAKFDAYFTEVDSGNKGFITGEEAVPFFSGSKLPEDALAQIWDLADIHKNGTLTRDEFAIAMHLIRMERTKGTNGKGLPDILPVNYIPPNMRAQLGFGANPQVSQGNVSAAFESAPQIPEKKSTYDDLFGLEDSFAPTPTAPVLAPTKTGPDSQGFTPFTASSDLFGGSQKATVQPSGSVFAGGPKPFIPSSSFGQSILSPSMTGGSSSSTPLSRGIGPAQSIADDLLGDNDPEVSRKLTSESTELANLSNQIGSLTKQTQDLKTKRASAEQNLSNVSAQKQEIEAKLSALRQQYEKEEKDVRRVEEQLAISRAETTRLRNDYALIEASLTDLQTRRAEVDAAYKNDQQENNNLKERMKVVNVEINALKPELEKLKSDARQQKGLVAISKKQLSTAESERDKVKSDMEVERKDLAATQELLRKSSPGPPASPTLSQTSVVSNNPFSNPFHRRSPPPAQESAFSPSPFAPSGNVPASQSAFENVFGSSFTGSNAPVSAPPVTFQRQDTGGTRELNTNTTNFSASPAVSEGGVFGGSTPPTSPPTSSYSIYSEAPPPPSATGPQITSAFLPLQVARADSMTSSVQVQPSDAGASRPETPTAWSDAPQEGRNELDRSDREVIKPSPLSQSTNSAAIEPVPVERHTTGSTMGGNPTATRPVEKRNSFSSNIVSGSPTVTNVSGAISNLDTLGPIKPTPTGESYMSNVSNISRGSQPKTHSEFGNARHDPFSFAKDDGRAPPASKDDFDAAFAGFEPSKPSEKQAIESRGLGTKQQEFPPIEEHFSDDSSESSHPGGFEDDFTTGKQSRRELHPSDTTSLPTFTNATSMEMPQFAQPSGPGTPLPGPNAQASPPPYQVSPGLGTETNPFPPEFTNLLPQRGDPTKIRTLSESSNSAIGQQNVSRFMASPVGTPTQVKSPSIMEPSYDVFASSVSDPARDVFASTATPTNLTSIQNSYSNAPTGQANNQGHYGPFSTSPVNTTTMHQSTKPITAVDEFDDDDFANLSDAREGDLKEEGVDEFKHHDFDDFNPVFDSPVPSKPSTATNTMSNTYNVGTAHGGDSDFDNFHSNAGMAQGYTQATTTSHFAPQTQTSSNEWDALFANLDDNKPAQPQLPSKEPLSPVSGPSALARNLLNGRSGDVSGISIASGNTFTNNNKDNHNNDNAGMAFASGPTSTGGVVKEDVKLHELQDMGFDESKASQALKKFNGNLGEATNYLLDMPTTPRAE